MRTQTHLPQHPLRARVLDEIHARPFEPVKTPCVVLRYVFWQNEDVNARSVLSDWCKARDLKEPEADARRYTWKDGSALLIWEAHAEFVSLSWYGQPEHVPEADPFSVFGKPSPVMGDLINAVRIDVRAFGNGDVPEQDDALSNVLAPDLEQFHFDSGSLSISHAASGKAMIASDFRQDEFGLTRFVIIDLGMRAINCGVLVRRLAEIETYRAVALLGLPEAQRVSPVVTGLERELSEIFRRLNTVKDTRENQDILNRLYRIAMDLEAAMIESQYRFAASRAYVGIVEQRLQALDEEPHLDYVTFKTFLLRRIMPAIHTCEAMERRQTKLAEKISRASDLLRTQLDIDLQGQNQGLLKALNERSEMQFRLQQTVEGLSVVAISYYAVSLLYYVYRGVAAPFGLNVNFLVALSVPVVAALVWMGVRRLRHSADGKG